MLALTMYNPASGPRLVLEQHGSGVELIVLPVVERPVMDGEVKNESLQARPSTATDGTRPTGKGLPRKGRGTILNAC